VTARRRTRGNYGRALPPDLLDYLQRPSYCDAGFALEQICEVGVLFKNYYYYYYYYYYYTSRLTAEWTALVFSLTHRERERGPGPTSRWLG